MSYSYNKINNPVKKAPVDDDGIQIVGTRTESDKHI